MSDKCYADRCKPFGQFVGMDIPDNYPVVFLKDEDVINLKGRELRMNDCRVCYYANRIWDK